MDARRITIVVPVLNEAEGIVRALQALKPLRARGHEVIVVDGGSGDDTVARAEPLADRILHSERGRAAQMNAGAAAAMGDIVWFLHADTLAPDNGDLHVLAALADPTSLWGRFSVRLSGRHLLFRFIEAMMNLRSCLSGIATGDQGIFVRRGTFTAVGGYPRQPLLEDIALSRRLRRLGRPRCLRSRLVTSSRRWEQRGVVRTVMLMWRLRFLYMLGADPARLARQYR